MSALPDLKADTSSKESERGGLKEELKSNEFLDTQPTRPFPYKIIVPKSSISILKEISEENKDEGKLIEPRTERASNRSKNQLEALYKQNTLRPQPSPSFAFLDASSRQIMNHKHKIGSKSQLGSDDLTRQGSKLTVRSPNDQHRRTFKRPRVFAEKLEGLKSMGDTKKLQAAERDIVQSMVINAGCDLKEKVKMLDLVRLPYQIIKFRKENDTEEIKRRNAKIHKLVIRFIDNLRNAVWARKESEFVREEESKQNVIKDMYTKNILRHRIKGDITEMPEALSKINRRNADFKQSKGRRVLIKKILRSEEEL